jgi:apolipoprotein D and lipocalin family protein
MRKWITITGISAIAGLFFLSGCTGEKEPPYAPVTGFALQQYLGKWYEIARLPNRFEKDLVNVTATYSLRDDGKVRVQNEGDKPDGKHKMAIGKAKLAGKSGEGYLRVSFFGPFYADYVVVALDKENYQYALVASSDKYLWVLSRTPQLDENIYQQLLQKARELGFDTSKLYVVPQNASEKQADNR